MKYIFCGDIHLRDKTPVNRIDEDFMATQERKFRWILDTAKQQGAVLLIAGDLFQVAKPTPFLLAWTIKILYEYKDCVDIMVTPGNHDLPYHRIDYLEESGLAPLKWAGLIEIYQFGYHVYHRPEEAILEKGANLYFSEFNAEVPVPEEGDVPNILVSHRMLIDDTLYPGQVADSAKTFLRKNRLFKIIASGDNHATIYFKAGDRHIFNSGAMMRAEVDETDRKPCIGLWDSEKDDFQILYLPIAPPEEVLNFAKVEVAKELNHNVDLFVAELLADVQHIDFVDNLKDFFLEKENTNIAPSIKQFVWSSLGETYVG